MLSLAFYSTLNHFRLPYLTYPQHSATWLSSPPYSLVSRPTFHETPYSPWRPGWFSPPNCVDVVEFSTLSPWGEQRRAIGVYRPTLDDRSHACEFLWSRLRFWVTFRFSKTQPFGGRWLALLLLSNRFSNWISFGATLFERRRLFPPAIIRVLRCFYDFYQSVEIWAPQNCSTHLFWLTISPTSGAYLWMANNRVHIFEQKLNLTTRYGSRNCWAVLCFVVWWGWCVWWLRLKHNADDHHEELRILLG